MTIHKVNLPHNKEVVVCPQCGRVLSGDIGKYCLEDQFSNEDRELILQARNVGKVRKAKGLCVTCGIIKSAISKRVVEVV